MQRYNKHGGLEEVPIILPRHETLEDKPAPIPIPHECYNCEVSHCFYLIHREQLGERVLTDCDRLASKRSSKYVLSSERVAEVIMQDTQARIDMRLALRELDIPSSEERRRLLKILFEKDGV